jgi:hypothetical protein
METYDKINAFHGWHLDPQFHAVIIQSLLLRILLFHYDLLVEFPTLIITLLLSGEEGLHWCKLELDRLPDL